VVRQEGLPSAWRGAVEFLPSMELKLPPPFRKEFPSDLNFSTRRPIWLLDSIKRSFVRRSTVARHTGRK